MARTPVRQMRLSDELWGRVNAAAKELGTDATGFTRIALEAALSGPPDNGVASAGVPADDPSHERGPNGRAGRPLPESAASKATRRASRKDEPATPPASSSRRVGLPGRPASSFEARGGQIRTVPKTPGARKPPPRPEGK